MISLNFIKKPKEGKQSQEASSIVEFIKSLSVAIVLAFAFRSLFFDPYNIPSGSMKPTLLVGDYIFVSKYSYGYSRYSFPFGINFFEGRIFESKIKRGDVTVFKKPNDTGTNYIKRIIGLPGDEIQMVNGTLYINGEQIPKKRINDFIDNEKNGSIRRIAQYEETLPNGVKYRVLDEFWDGPTDNTRIYKVPEGHYFALGDNRDNSADSRILSSVGYIPKDHILGPAKVVFFSNTAALFEVWRWIPGFRSDRFFENIDYTAN